MAQPSAAPRSPWLSRAWMAGELEYRLRAGPLFLSQFALLGPYMAWRGTFALPIAPLPGVIAIVASAIGLVARVWGTGMLSAATMVSMAPVTDRLVTQGVFRLVRNPLYLADLLIFSSYAVLLNPWLTPVFALYHVVRVRRLIAFEEQRLLARWGPAYETYCRQVPRLIPRLARVEPAPVNWREGLKANTIWIGFFVGYVAAVITGDVWSLTWPELAGFLFFFYQYSRKTSPAADDDVAGASMR